MPPRMMLSCLRAARKHERAGWQGFLSARVIYVYIKGPQKSGRRRCKGLGRVTSRGERQDIGAAGPGYLPVPPRGGTEARMKADPR